MPAPEPVRARRLVGLAGGVLAVALAASFWIAAAKPDPLATAIHERAEWIRTTKGGGQTWRQVADGSRGVLASADSALARGDRELALQRLAEVWADLEGARFLLRHDAGERGDMRAFEAEWKRQGATLEAPRGGPAAHALECMAPAAVRAQAEAALPQARIYYDASLDYARSTSPAAGLFYLGTARGQREFVELCRTLAERSPRRAPPVRPLHGELEALEDALLAAYRPPASIDLHPRFIEASSALKEARELDEAGLHYGALLRYLLAVQLASRVRGAPPSVAAAELAGRLKALRARMTRGDIDHSIGMTFLESAEEDFASAAPESAHATASAIVTDVLPRYFDALASARPETARPAAEIAVTLVRWPYT